MIKLNNISIQNLGGIVEQTITFNQGICTIIIGDNQKDSGQKSNGAGKSLILEALYFSCVGEFIRKMQQTKSLIRDGEDFLFIKTQFIKNKQNFLTISRKFYRKGGQDIILELGPNFEKEVCAGVTQYNQRILEILSTTKDKLLNYYFIHKEKYVSFLFGKEKDRRDLILEVSEAKELDEKRDLVSQKETTELEVQSKILASIEGYKESIDQNEREIIQLNKKIDKNNLDLKFLTQENKKKALNKEIEELHKQNSITNNLVINHKNRIKILEGWENRIPSIESQKETREKAREIKKEIKEEIEGFENTINLLNKQISVIDSKLESLVTCPECNNIFKPKDSFKKEEGLKEKKYKKKQLEDHFNQIKESRGELQETEDYIEELTNEIEKHDQRRASFFFNIQSYLGHIDSLENIIKSNKALIESKGSEILSLNDSRNKFVKTIEDLIKGVKDKDKLLEQKIRSENVKLKQSERLSLKYSFWKNILKRFEIYLINSTIETISSIINIYLSELGSDLTIEIQGYKLLGDGKTIREEVTPFVFRDNKPISDIGRLSSGEKTRLSICTLLAFQEILNNQSKIGGIDFLYLDEIIESTDSEGTDNLIESLSNLDSTINLVTHASNKTLFNMKNIKAIKKESGEIVYKF